VTPFEALGRLWTRLSSALLSPLSTLIYHLSTFCSHSRVHSPLHHLTQRLEKPSKTEFESRQTELKATLDAKVKTLNAAIDAVKKTQGNGKNPALDALHDELNDIKSQQNAFKQGKQGVFDEIKTIDQRISGRIKDVQAAKAKLPVRNSDEVEKRIAQLEDSVESGQLRILDEKKALTEISQLKKSKAAFANIAKMEEAIAADKETVAGIRAGIDDSESKKLHLRAQEIIKKIEESRAERNELKKSRDALYAARDKAFEEKHAANAELQALRDEYYGALKQYQDQYAADMAVRREKEKEERQAYEKEKRLERAKAKLEIASTPAFGVEIVETENLLNFFEKESGASPAAESKASSPSPSIDPSKVIKKDVGTFMEGTGGKRGKKTRGAKAGDKFNLNLTVIESLSALSIGIPGSKSEVPEVVEQLKKKLNYYKDNQDKVTKENIRKAEEEIAKAEEAVGQEQEEA
jgi:uncharacterized coiled-coil DUF342 family protein